MTKNQLSAILNSRRQHDKETLPAEILLPEAVREFRPISLTELELIRSGEAVAKFKTIKYHRTAKFLRDPDAKPRIFYSSLENALPPDHRWCLIGYYIDPQELNLILEFFPCDAPPLPFGPSVSTGDELGPSSRPTYHGYISEHEWQQSCAPLVQRIVVTGHFSAFFYRSEESGEYVKRDIYKNGKIFCTMVEIESMCKRRRVTYESGSEFMIVRDYDI